MSDDYLWDRTGEVDPHVKEIEDLLGTLRYQPKPLVIPTGIRPERSHSVMRVLAIAAGIAMVLGGTALWLSTHQRPDGRSRTADVIPQPTQLEGNSDEMIVTGSRDNSSTPSGGTDSDQRPKRLLVKKRVREDVADRLPVPDMKPGLTPSEETEKAQLMVALRLVSVKLNIAQRKTQGGPALNFNRMQRPMGL